MVVSGQAFPTTRWSVVLDLGASQPFAELCMLYREPLLAYAQRARRFTGPDAEDVVQEFFAQLAADQSLHPGGPAQGLFRSYLLGAFKNHLSNHSRRQSARKRGGGVAFEHMVDNLPADAEAANAPSEVAYDRAWAVTTLSQAMGRVELAYVKAGRGALFFAARKLLEGDKESQRQVAQNLEVSEAAVRVAVHRLRRRLSREVRAVVASTVSDVRDIEAEVQYLTVVLQRSSWSLGFQAP